MTPRNLASSIFRSRERGGSGHAQQTRHRLRLSQRALLAAAQPIPILRTIVAVISMFLPQTSEDVRCRRRCARGDVQWEWGKVLVRFGGPYDSVRDRRGEFGVRVLT